MGFLQDLGSEVFALGRRPASIYHDEVKATGWMSQQISSAPDARPLLETDELNAVIARCVNALSDDCGQIPLIVEDVTGPKPKKVTDHHVVELFGRINPVETTSLHLSGIFADALLEGNAFDFIDLDSKGKPVSMIRMAPERVKVISDPVNIVGGFIWERDLGEPQRYSRREVMHYKTRNRNSIYRGSGHLIRLRHQILLDRAMRSWQINHFRNGIPTQMILEVQKSFAGEKEFNEWGDQFWQKMKGVQNVGKPVFVRKGDLHVTPLPRPTQEELGFLASLRYTRNEIAMLFGIPPVRLSDYGEAFRANASEQSTSYHTTTIMGWHTWFLDFCNSVFLPEYYPELFKRSGMPTLRFSFDYSQVRALVDSTKSIAELTALQVRHALQTPNEAREILDIGLSDDPAADELYWNGTKLGGAAEPADPEDDLEPGEEEEPADPELEDDEDPGDPPDPGDKKKVSRNGRRASQPIHA